MFIPATCKTDDTKHIGGHPSTIHRNNTRMSSLGAQLFEGRLALNPGLNLTQVSLSFVQKHFLGQFSLLFLRASSHQLVDKKN